MAKRFTDTEKWKDPWFKKLKGKYQLFWLFVLDTCDCAGIWKDQFDDFEFFSGFKMGHPDIKKTFSDRMTLINSESYLVQKFIPFQYGNLNPEKNNAHKGVIKSLNYNGIAYPFLGASQGLVRGLLAPQDKEQEQDKDMDKDKDKEQDKDKDTDYKKNLPKVLPKDFRNPKDSPELFSIEAPQLEEDMSISQKAANVLTIFNSLTFKNFRPVPGNMKHINARLKEGYALEDFKKVIQFKYSEWINDPKFAHLVRPETILGNKFDGYLQAASNPHLGELEDKKAMAELTRLFPGIGA